MSEIDNGGPAFPIPGDVGNLEDWKHGMSLRDYFAAKAMNAVLANNGGAVQANSACGWSLCNCTFSDVAEFSYQVADAMLAERERQK